MRKFIFNIIFCVIFVACGANNNVVNVDSKESKTEQSSIKSVKQDSNILQDSKDIQEINEDFTHKEFVNTLKEEREKYQKKCNNKDGDSCVKLAISYQSGNDKDELGIKDLYQKAAMYLQHDCNNGDMYACSGLGVLYESGDGVTKSIQKSKELYEKSCENNDSRGCFNLALLINGCLNCEKNDKHKITKALKYFKKACKLGSNNACQMATKIYKNSKEKLDDDHDFYISNY